MKKLSELERAKKEITELKRHFLMKRREEFSADLRAKQQFLEFTDGDLRLKNENFIFEQILTLIKGGNKKNGKTTLQLDKYEDDTCLPQYRVKDIHGEVLTYFSFEDQRNDLLYLINQLDVSKRIQKKKSSSLK